MSIASRLDVLKGDIRDAFSAVEEKGVEISPTMAKNTKNLIDSIKEIKTNNPVKSVAFNCGYYSAYNGAYFSAKTVGLYGILVKGSGSPSKIMTSGPTAYPVGSQVIMFDRHNGDILFESDSIPSVTDCEVGYRIPLHVLWLTPCDSEGNKTEGAKPMPICMFMEVVDTSSGKVWRYHAADLDGNNYTLPSDQYYVLTFRSLVVLQSMSGGPTGGTSMSFVNMGYTFVKPLGSFYADDNSGSPTAVDDVKAIAAYNKLRFLALTDGLCTYGTTGFIRPTSVQIGKYASAVDTTPTVWHTENNPLAVPYAIPMVLPDKIYDMIKKVQDGDSGAFPYMAIKVGANHAYATSNLNTVSTLSSMSLNKGMIVYMSTDNGGSSDPIAGLKNTFVLKAY